MSIKKIFRLKPAGFYLVAVALDIFCIGMGMGIPLFNIIFGFLLGWYLVKWISLDTSAVTEILKKLLIYSCVIAGVTFLGMLIIWGWSAKMLFSSEAEIINFGIPQILYTPRMSLFGWLILMIIISPFLQLLTTMFAGNLTLLSLYRKTFKEKTKTTA